MTDTIERQAAIDAIDKAKTVRNESCEMFVAKINAQMNIEQLPPVQPERPKGEWISADAIFGGVPFYCSECGEKTLDTVMGKPRWNFCPNCGADMRLTQYENN